MDQALQIHNDTRAAAPGGSRPSLSWDNSLSAAAQSWANHLASIDSLQHDPNAGAGENIFWGSGSSSFADAAQAWVNERENYHGENIGDGNFGSYGHYTQVIWPETTRVGMASATSANGGTYIVGRYLEQGNIVGQTAWRAGSGGPSPGPGGPTPGQSQDGVYLVNSYKDGHLPSSGFAWYRSLGNNDGQQPDAYIDIKTDGTVTWEGNTFSGTFADGNVFTCTVNGDGQAVPLYSTCGHAKNSFRDFDVHRDNIRVLYEIDGWKVYTIYYC